MADTIKNGIKKTADTLKATLGMRGEVSKENKSLIHSKPSLTRIPTVNSIDCREFLDKRHGFSIKPLLHPDMDRLYNDEEIDQELFDNLHINYSLTLFTLSPGKSSPAIVANGADVYYILQGHGRMHIEGLEEDVKEGEIVYIPPHAKRFIENNGKKDLQYLSIANPAWKAAEFEKLAR